MDEANFQPIRITTSDPGSDVSSVWNSALVPQTSFVGRPVNNVYYVTGNHKKPKKWEFWLGFNDDMIMMMFSNDEDDDDDGGGGDGDNDDDDNDNDDDDDIDNAEDDDDNDDGDDNNNNDDDDRFPNFCSL